MLQIHDMLVWIRIRIRGFMPLTNGSGSGSCYFRHWSLRCQLKTYYFFCLLLFEGTFKTFFKDKNQKESQNSTNQGFSYYFCKMIEGSGSIPLTNGSGSGKPKNMWIRWIRIRNTALYGLKHEILVAEFFYTLQAFNGKMTNKVNKKM